MHSSSYMYMNFIYMKYKIQNILYFISFPPQKIRYFMQFNHNTKHRISWKNVILFSCFIIKLMKCCRNLTLLIYINQPMVNLALFQYTLFSLNSQNLFTMFCEGFLYNKKEHNNVSGKKNMDNDRKTHLFFLIIKIIVISLC